MCAAAVRLGDVCTGHSCFPSRPNIQGSPNVFCNDLPVHRVGDAWPVHCCGKACHPGSAASGSPNVFANDMPRCRVGDAVSCGSTMAEGSPNVWIND